MSLWVCVVLTDKGMYASLGTNTGEDIYLASLLKDKKGVPNTNAALVTKDNRVIR